MFRTIAINLDFKDLEMIQNSLENEIDYLNTQVITTEEDKGIIDEHKQLLHKIKNNLKKFQNF